MKRTSGNRFQWLAAVVLAMLCTGLAVVQYRWTGELSAAELEQLQKQSRQDLEQLSTDFNARVRRAVSMLAPTSAEVARQGRDVYWSKVAQWRARGEPIFSRVALAIPNQDDGLDLLIAGTGSLDAAAWPAEWQTLREWLLSHLTRGSEREGPSSEARSPVIEIPRFGQTRPGTPAREQEWLLLEPNRKWLGEKLMPELIARHLGPENFDAAIFGPAGRFGAQSKRGREVIYESSPGIGDHLASNADAEADIMPVFFGGRPPGRGPDRKGGRARGSEPPGLRGGGPRPGDSGQWRIAIRHHDGSLQAIVAQSRRRNIAVSLGVLALILATSALLIRTAREQSRLAELQMNFVASVSHELRTPLTVIRTAAFNLQGKLAGRPEHVERYGKLIHEESTRLMGIVEQVLLLARGRAANAEKRLVSPSDLIQRSLRSSMAGSDPPPCRVECRIEPNLPPVCCDEQAITQALRNLIDNAVKYGLVGGWVGIFAAERNGEIEVRVADRGPGVPADEQPHIFDEFFRGHKAIDDQVHGTGLGLSLARRIVEDNGGRIRVQDHSAGGAEFILNLPIAKDFYGAHSSG